MHLYLSLCMVVFVSIKEKIKLGHKK
jgi:hypothetical protein